MRDAFFTSIDTPSHLRRIVLSGLVVTAALLFTEMVGASTPGNAGTEVGSLWHCQELYAKTAGPKKFVVIAGATNRTSMTVMVLISRWIN